MPPRDSNTRVSYRVVSHLHLQYKAVAVPRNHCIKEYGGRVTLHEFLNSPPHVNVWWFQAWFGFNSKEGRVHNESPFGCGSEKEGCLIQKHVGVTCSHVKSSLNLKVNEVIKRQSIPLITKHEILSKQCS
jgi:hypothetical protein